MCRAPLGCAQSVLALHMQVPDKEPFFVYSCRIAYLYGRTDIVSVFECTGNLVLKVEMKLIGHLFTYQYNVLLSMSLHLIVQATQHITC